MAEALDDAVRVYFVASDAQLGGAELYLATLVEQLGGQWVDGAMVLGAGPLVERLVSVGTAPAVAPCRRRAEILRAAGRLRRAIRARSTPLVHANGAKAALVSVIAAAGTPTRVVWHRHDPTHDGRLGRWIARRCALVVGVTTSALGELADADGVRSRVVPNGVLPSSIDRAAARHGLLQELAAPPDAAVVGVVGRLHPGKGQLELVEISARLRARVPGVRVVLAGAVDPHVPAYERLLRARAADRGLDGVVHFLGYRDDAVSVIAGCDVLVVPSMRDPVSGWREGFSLVAVEAMTIGTPVVAYAEPALVDVLGPCARVVATGDRDALTSAIAELLGDDDARARLADCGRSRARGFRLEDAVERMKETYVAAAPRRDG